MSEKLFFGKKFFHVHKPENLHIEPYILKNLIFL